MSLTRSPFLSLKACWALVWLACSLGAALPPLAALLARDLRWLWLWVPAAGLVYLLGIRGFVHPTRDLLAWAQNPLEATPPSLPRFSLISLELVDHTQNLVSLVQQLWANEESLRDQYAQITRRERQIDALFRAARILGEGQDPKVWFGQLGSFLGDRFDLLGADLYLHDPKRDALVRRACWARSPDLYDDLEVLPLNGTATVCARAFRTGEIQNVGTVESCPFYLAGNGTTRSQMAMPLYHWGKPLGVLSLESASPDAFPEEDALFYQGLAELASQEVDNLLHHEGQRRHVVQALTGLARAVELRDPYTGQHQERVASLAVHLGETLGLNREDLKDLKTAALLHDIGKIGIADTVLLKPAGLEPQERQQVRTHAEKGAELLRHLQFLGSCLEGVRHHHERWDGKGYPEGLSGERIPLMARIIALADSYDAMTTHRIYRAPSPPEEALEEIRRCAGQQFDPRLAEVFCSLLETEEAPVPQGA